MSQKDIFSSVNEMYELVPFPQYDHDERVHNLPDEILRYKYLNIDSKMKGARMLDVGCGTGDRSILVAKHYKVKELVGLDACKNSLEIASKVAQEEAYPFFTPVNGSLFEIPFQDNYFDIVVSWGVLHHTGDPFEGLKEMKRVCKEGGFIGFFVYNSYADWRHNLQRKEISRKGGKTIKSRLDFALKKYSKRPFNSLTKYEISRFYDQYVQPHKSDHTLEEILSWQKALNLDYSGSFPPIQIKQTINYIKDRSTYVNRFPIRTFWGKVIINFSRILPRFKNKLTYPSKFSLIFWQFIFALQGAGGKYSQGVAIGSIKKKNKKF